MSEVIQLLPDNIANQIAAGEVIQRPASVVKELMENAVDAGATKIELHVKDAGKTLIQVIDDGVGMSKADALMCFERHATSKLKTADDLFQLTTKGFRGEALASIAAIAHVDLETMQTEHTIGSKVNIVGSKVNNQEPVARAQGTSISVKNLFFNVPARRNFLKSEHVESKHINEEFTRIALAHPEIAFVYTHNGNTQYDLPKGTLRKRIVGIHGNNFNTKLVPVEENTDIVSIKGFVGKPEFVRKTRGEQYFFVNNRFFKDHYLHHAVSSAFENLIPPKTYPSYFLFLTVDPKTIDVNIHPTKTEIKFQEDRNIYSILKSTIKLALGVHNIAPTIDFEQEPQFDISLDKQKEPIRQPQIKVDPNYNPFKTSSSAPASGKGQTGFRPLQPNKADWENFYNVEEEEDTSENTVLIDSQEDLSTYNYFQLHKKYLMVQTKSGVLMIHLKRAKERILYDELIARFMQQPIASQQLMFPIEYSMRSSEKEEWISQQTSLERLGFSWEFNKNTLVLSAIPAYLDVDEVQHCIEKIIQQIVYEKIDKGELAHTLVLAIAQSSSRSFNQNLKEEEQTNLVDQLFSSQEHQYSPSGKKIMETVTLDELDKRFK